MTNKELKQHMYSYVQSLRLKGFSRHTSRKYQLVLEEYFEWAQDKPFTPQAIRDFHSHLIETNKGTRTQYMYLSVLRSFIGYLDRSNLSIFTKDKIELPKLPEQNISFLTAYQIKQLFNACEVHKKKGVRDRALLELLFSTGLRVSELCALNKLQIAQDPETGIVRELTIVGKGGKARLIFISSQASFWLLEYLKIRRRDSYSPLFISIDGHKEYIGKRLSPYAVRGILKRLGRKAGIPVQVSPHMLRHAYAYDLLQNGANLRLVQELLGHRSISSTQLYTRVSNIDLKEGYLKYHSGNSLLNRL